MHYSTVSNQTFFCQENELVSIAQLLPVADFQMQLQKKKVLFWQQWSNSDWKTLVDYNTNECIIKTILKDTFFGYINEKNRKV